MPDSRVGEMVVGVGVRGVWGDPSSSISVKNAFCADRVFRVNFFPESRGVYFDTNVKPTATRNGGVSK